MTDLIVAVLLVGGGAFALVAGVGLWRLPDVIIRMHASTKAGTLGTGLILAAVAVYYGDPPVILRAAATIAFLLITAPVSAHMIGRAAYRTGVPLSEHTVVDELRGVSPPAPAPTAPSPSDVER
jgi:multicomponent Na+:H+ antiporter subunit G